MHERWKPRFFEAMKWQGWNQEKFAVRAGVTAARVSQVLAPGYRAKYDTVTEWAEVVGFRNLEDMMRDDWKRWIKVRK